MLITAGGFIPRWLYQRKRRLVKEQRRAEEEAERARRRAEDKAERIEQGCQEVRSNFANDSEDQRRIIAMYGVSAGKKIFQYKQKILSLLLDKNSEDFEKFPRIFKQLWHEFCAEHEGELLQGSIPKAVQTVDSMQRILDRIALVVELGDPAAYARFHYGRPDDVESKIGPRVEREVWKYDEYQTNRYRRRIIIKNGVIDSIEEK